ncbi:MAG: hypothetical protein FWC86_06440 [Coriobacteriia bacterium]|nr:hypothetical protein [Coriobacteriia bacterium]
MQHIVVHPRVNRKRPEIENVDAIAAWRNAIAVKQRRHSQPVQHIAAGADTKGRMLQVLAVEFGKNDLLIYHAMKLTASTRKELGL